jgi:hypothetical protein
MVENGSKEGLFILLRLILHDGITPMLTLKVMDFEIIYYFFNGFGPMTMHNI